MPDDSQGRERPTAAGTATAPAELRCSQASRALANDPAGSSSDFDSFLLLTEPGSWSRTAADDAADAQLDPAAAAWVRNNRDGLRPFAIRPVEGRRTADRDRFLAGRVGDGDDLRCFTAPPSVPELTALTLGRPVGDPVEGPLVGICTNGSRDRCCAIAGRPIAQQALAILGGQQVVEISHLGGHRFAGTMVVLPWGYSYGFLDPDSAVAVLQDVADGLVHPTHLRGRATLSPAAQAAEIHWRRELGAAPPDAVSVIGERAEDDVTVVSGTVDGRPESLRMRYRDGAKVTQTACGGKPFGTGTWLAG
ncbi:sucrase ferredoxin [Nakamurella lactea]|uniref:sucrase ferredoxin n=1 Tax=Nakamurella lactea TaxID=459515 RepID=UPI00040492FA|nr:sucrase ferredoxin [Nakamurella lactea]